MDEYDVNGAPSSWSRVPAMRHAMTIYPYTTYFFHLDQRALIMNPSLSIEEHVMNPLRLESLMLKDLPVVPPDSVIKTFSHLRPDHVDLVLTQDDDGLGVGSMILRHGEWAKFFLDGWFDPIYRNYNFQKAEIHALVRLQLRRFPFVHLFTHPIHSLHPSSFSLTSSSFTRYENHLTNLHSPHHANPHP